MRASIVAFLVVSAMSATRAVGDETADVDHAPPDGMVYVPAGEFLMGNDDGAYDEAPAHRVRLSAFYMDRFEVTNGQFAKFVRDAGCYEQIEGAWFRHSAEGCVDLLAYSRQKYGCSFAELVRSLEDSLDDETTRPRRTDAARWRAARTALLQMLQRETPHASDLDLEDLSKIQGLTSLVADQAAFPVRSVTWRDAQAYATWAGKRLPTEAEWERAARGDDGRIYPWGDTWRAENCRSGLAPPLAAVFSPGSRLSNHSPSSYDVGPAPVGSHLLGESPYGCHDMAGNVWEWTADWYGEQYYAQSQGVENPRGPAGLNDGQLPTAYSDRALLRTPQQGRSDDTRKVIRGGGWAGPPNAAAFNARTTRRLWSNPGAWQPDLGFRCAQDVSTDSER